MIGVDATIYLTFLVTNQISKHLQIGIQQNLEYFFYYFRSSTHQECIIYELGVVNRFNISRTLNSWNPTQILFLLKVMTKTIFY